MNKKLFTLHILNEILSVASMGVALFWSAGRLDWLPAWGLVAVTFAWTAATLAVTLRAHPALLAERHDVDPAKPDFTVQTQQDIIATQEATTAAFRDL